MSATRWRKMGVLIPGEGGAPWRATHAALPIAHPLKDRRTLVYVSSRDAENRARVCAAEVDWSGPTPAVRPAAAPALDLGELGCFDDTGVTGSSLVAHDEKLYLYYTGWTRTGTVRFQLFSGLAISADNGRTFSRWSRAPLLERTAEEPFLNASPFVLKEGRRWRMWYVSGEGWRDAGEPRYRIKYAESGDGLRWRRDGTVCIDFASPDEHAIARPCVRKEGGVYRMWFCARGAAYRLGYAESKDGVRWRRRDADAGLDVSASGWDSEMVAYPFVFEESGRKIMLYNGNGYGRTGLGWAVAEG